MPRHTVIWGAALAALTLPVAAAPAQAQKQGQGQVKQEQNQKQEQKPNQGAPQSGARDVPRPMSGPGPGAQVKEAIRMQAAEAADPEAHAERMVLLEEAKYRERMAQISRLRELAESQGNQQMLAKVGDLEQKVQRLHETKLVRWKERMGKDKFSSVEEKIERGRGPKAASRGNAEKARGDRTADSRGSAPPSAPAGAPEAGQKGSKQKGEKQQTPGTGDKPGAAPQSPQKGAEKGTEKGTETGKGGVRPKDKKP